jgi:N-acylneuraminate-9-phosphatase
MLKALFLDMDETLCDTLAANNKAIELLTEKVNRIATSTIDGQRFAQDYVAGIYRQWSEQQQTRYSPIVEQQSEGAFRLQLIRDLLACQQQDVSSEDAQSLQQAFDNERIKAFDFYPGVTDFLLEARKLFCLVVITNGPEYSQIPKVERVRLADYVDHIIIGGQEPAQKPATSIFEKALRLAQCQAHEAIHVGDSLAADIAGANDSGISSIWIQHQQPLDAELGINPDHTVFHPSELPALLRRLHKA